MRQGAPVEQDFVQRKNVFASVVVMSEWWFVRHALAC